MKKNRWILLQMIVVVGLLITGGCTPNGQTLEPTLDSALEAETDPVVSATGIVVPLQYATLSTSSTGTIADLLVAEGDPVKKGDVLIRLAGTEKVNAAIETAKLELLAAEQALEDLNDNAEQARAAAQLRLAKAQDAFDEAEKRRGWKEYRTGNDNQIDEARANLILAEDALEQAEDMYGVFADSDQDNLNKAAALSALSAARRARDRAESNLNYLLALPDAVEVAKADAELEVARTELDAAQREFDKLQNGPDPEALSLAEARLNNARAQIAAGESSLADMELKAPFDGTVSKLNARLSEWVMPGQPVLVVADLSHLRVETTDLSEIDVARTRVGDPATITFDALPDVVADGKITHSASKSSEGSGVNYTVTIDLDEIPDSLRWGMTAFVDIRISD